MSRECGLVGTTRREDFKEIFSAIWKNLDANQKNWKVMFKVGVRRFPNPRRSPCWSTF